MRSISHEQTVTNRFIGNSELIQNPISWFPYGHLVHQVASNPEPSAEVVVSLNYEHFLASSCQTPACHKPAGTSTNDDAIAFNIFLELLRELRNYSTSYILFTYWAELFHFCSPSFICIKYS